MSSVTTCDGRTVALTSTGKLWGWGGFLGDGPTESRWLGDSGADSYQYTVVGKYDNDPEYGLEIDPDFRYHCVSVPKLVNPC